MAIEDVVIKATAQQIEDMATRQISQEITEDSSAEELVSAKAVHDSLKKLSESTTNVVVNDSEIGKNVWTSKNTVDKLCPSFSKSGSIVTCEPVEGYPLTITAEGATTITRCGKNLLNDGWKSWDNWDKENKRFLLNLPAGNYAISAAKPAKETYLYLQKSVDSGSTWTEHGKILANTTARTITFTVADGEMWALWTSKESYLALIDSLQIEMGSTKTAYEPFRGDTFGVGDPVHAIAGINCIYADTRSVTVHGKADPVAIIEKLTNAIVSLGGNI